MRRFKVIESSESEICMGLSLGVSDPESKRLSKFGVYDIIWDFMASRRIHMVLNSVRSNVREYLKCQETLEMTTNT